MSGWVARGEAEAERLLAAIPERLRRSRAVAHRAREVADLVEVDDRDLLIAAAWVHDIGYALALRESGFHPLDGARHLERCGWPPRVCALVAHHSGARFIADVRGLADQHA